MSFSNPPNYQNTYLPPVIQIPSALTITAISQSNPVQVTTSANSDQVNTYIPGQTVVLTVPQSFGMWQINGLVGQITNVNTNVISLNINSSLFDPFSIPAGSGQVATLAPFGSQNLQFSNQTDQVPFQSYNNIGN